MPGQEDLEILPIYQTAARDDEFKLLVSSLTEIARRHFENLLLEMNEILNSEPDCPGDGNLDKLVNMEDLRNWEKLAKDWGASSVYDFNFDGLSSDPDRSIISENLGRKCGN